MHAAAAAAMLSALRLDDDDLQHLILCGVSEGTVGVEDLVEVKPVGGRFLRIDVPGTIPKSVVDRISVNGLRGP
jgi:hypothetical protein